jgi:K(+)-stimulated pyrophosphate-energized sodium pump
VGVCLKFEGLTAFLTGVIVVGIPVTISSSNSGSAWDNSKKTIEMAQDGNYKLIPAENLRLRKQSLRNAIVGDNIGDAFKDIAGPTINILIKFSAYLSLILINFILI